MTTPSISKDEPTLYAVARAYFDALALTGWTPELGPAGNVTNMPTDCPPEYVDGAGHPIYGVMYRAVSTMDGTGRIAGDENVVQHADGTETVTAGGTTGRTIAEAEAEETRAETSTLPVGGQPAPELPPLVVPHVPAVAVMVAESPTSHPLQIAVLTHSDATPEHVSWLHAEMNKIVAAYHRLIGEGE